MLKRKAVKDMIRWKQNSAKRALMIVGARQVGKTYLVREFAREHYKHFAEINLVENAAARASLSEAQSAEDLALRISIAAPIELVAGETLIFLDEIQECPEIITYIKFLVERGDYGYVLSGSLLGVELENIRSWPVGYVTEITMYPLDFEEFCWANGLGEDAHAIVCEAFDKQEPVPDFLHRRLMEVFHRYLLVGGMPEAVVSFREAASIDQARVIQDNVIKYYQRDISKYAPRTRRLVVRDIYNLIPSELSAQNRRFRLSSISGVKRFTQVEDEFLWLTRANVALAAYNVKAPIGPLMLNESHSIFKLFMSDVGLLTSRFPKQALLGLLDGNPTASMGGVYENFVAQELAAHGFALRYFTGKKAGEVDFVVERKGGAIIALEVKSGKDYRTHAALTNVMNTPSYEVAGAYVLAETNVESHGETLYLPIYMTGLLGD
jgi:predicted AAA+ superfamily ATPase